MRQSSRRVGWHRQMCLKSVVIGNGGLGAAADHTSLLARRALRRVCALVPSRRRSGACLHSAATCSSRSSCSSLGLSPLYVTPIFAVRSKAESAQLRGGQAGIDVRRYSATLRVPLLARY